MQGGEGQDWGYLVLMDRLNERYDRVKVPESPGKVRLQENEAKEGVALGLEISAYQIQGNGVTICPVLEETHLGNSPIFKPKKVFGRKS